MVERPGFKSHYHVATVDGEGILLLSEKGDFLVQGRLYPLLAPWLDGRRSVDEIVAQLDGQAPASELREALTELEKRGYLADGDSTLSANEAALWAIQDIDPRTAARRLQESQVSVSTVGAVETGPLVAALHALRVRVGEPGEFCVVLTDDYLRSGLGAYNQKALESERPWLLLKPVGCVIWVGPLFWPGRTGCWDCLRHRLRDNRRMENFLQERSASGEPIPVARGFTPATLQIAWNMAATAIAKWIAQGESADLEGKVLTLDVRSWKTQVHTLVWRPQCPTCGDPDDCLERPAPPIVLASRKKTFTQDGGHRTQAPEVTLERFCHHVSPITGAVSHLAPCVVSNDGVMHAYQAGLNPALRHRTLEGLRKGLRSYSGGKGVTDVQAKASGLCEGLERYSGIFRGDEPRRRARLRDLGDTAIHLDRCLLFSPKQYQERQAWNVHGPRFNFVPIPFDEDIEIEWTPVWSLTRGESRYLPTAFCFFSYPLPDARQFCRSCSNGNAAGNTLEEAILQGFFELVERDAVALWWYNRLQRPAVALDSFDEPYLGKLRSLLESRQRELWVLDLTSDLGIPVFAALSRRTAEIPERIIMGLGAHFDPRIALLRAVTEVGQMLAWVMREEEETPPTERVDDPETVQWLQTATLANQPYLVPDVRTLPKVAADYPRCWTDDLKDDVLLCQDLVERLGLEMLVLDQTRPDIGLPVVKVIVPGLRHFWARFAPGRLYDVPVQMGWLKQPLVEEDLNPIPYFL